MFLNLRGYCSRLTSQQTGEFDLKVSVILNGLEKYVVLQLIKICFLLRACNL